MQIDDEAIALLRQQIEAQLALAAEERRKNDLTEQTLRQALAETQIRQVAERNRLQIQLDTNEKVAGLAGSLPQVFLAIHGIREWCREASRRLDRIDEILILQLSGRGNDNKARVTELQQELQQEHNQRLLVQEYDNLRELEEQKAEHGSIDLPLSLRNQIKKTTRRIEELEAKLNG